MEDKKFLGNIINIRALAILIVVFGHSIILYSTSWNLYNTNRSVPILDYIKKIINIIQMPLYFSLSGYLFRFSYNRNKGMCDLIKNKFLRLIVPYFCIGIFYLIPIRLIVGYPPYQNTNILMLIYEKLLLGRDNGHLWFLTALFLTFLLSYGMVKLLSKLAVFCQYKEIIFASIAFALHHLFDKISFGNPHLSNTLYYMVWFAFGYLINRYEKELRRLYMPNLLKTTLCIFNGALLLLTAHYGQLSFYISLFTILNIYMCVPSHTNKAFTKISDASFGIYLFHSPLIYFTYSSIPNASPILVVLINFIGGGLIAYGLNSLVLNSKLKFILGEVKRKKVK